MKLYSLLLSLLLISACQSINTPPAAEQVFVNGVIYTVDQKNSVATAMAVADGKITFVGNDTDVQQFVHASTRTTDLNGKMLLPGLVDAHLHPVRGALKDLYECNFSFTATPEQIQDKVAACVESQPDSSWIIGGQWGSAFFKNNSINSPRAWLDQVSKDKAVLLKDDSLHNIWVNSKALELAGMDKNTPDPAGGTIERNAKGEPNGVLLETAAKALRAIVPETSKEQATAAVREFIKQANSYGLTGAKTASTHAYELAALQNIDLSEGLTLNIASSMRTPDGQRDTQLDYDELEQARDKYASPRLDTRHVKLFLDGVPTPARTAAMLAPYINDDNHSHDFDGGRLLISKDALIADVTELDKRGFTIKIHAAGDRSVRDALDAIEAARNNNGNSGLRHEIAHAGYIDQGDIARFGELNAVADLSPVLWHPSSIIKAIQQAIHEPRASEYFPVRDLIDSKANLLAGSDWPAVGVSSNPWGGIEALVTRKNPASNTNDTLWAEQAITLAEALRIYSYEGAKALRKEDTTGSLEVGKSADFIILENNLFDRPIEEVSDTLPLETWFEGRNVFKRK